MKGIFRKGLAMLLTLALLASLCVGIAGLGLGADTDLTATLDQAKVYTGSEAQTVKLTIKSAGTLSVCGIGMTATAPGLTLTGYENNSENISFGTGDYNLETGRLSWQEDNLNDVATDELATVVFTVPAGIAAGEYVITVEGIKAVAENGAATVINGETVTATLTVADADAENAVLSAVLDKANIDMSSEAQTVKMSVSTAGPIHTCGIGMTAALPAGLTLAGFENNSANISFGTGDYNLETGKLSWQEANLNDVETDELATLIVTVPANTPAGEYVITAQDIKALAENGTKTLVSGETISATLTVVDPSVATGVALDRETLTLGKDSTATLTASLLPATTTDSIASAEWTSDNTAVATVADGVVTGLAEGTANVMVKVTTSAGKTFTSDPCAVTVALSPYTMTIADSVDGTAKVHPGDTVSMNVTVSGANFRTAGGVLTFDPALFALDSATSSFALNKSTPAEGQLKFSVNNAADIADGSTVLKLSFTAQAVTTTSTGNFGFNAATADVVENLTGDALAAATVTDAVTILGAFTVTYKVEGQADATEQVYDGESPVNVPADPTKEHYDFAGWKSSADTADPPTLLQKAAIEATVVTADVTYTAKFTPKTFDVDLPDDGSLTGDPTATYGDDYEVKIEDYDPENYDYEVEYEITDPVTGEVIDTGTATIDPTTGEAIIPGGEIIGNVTVTLTQTLKDATVEVFADYVTGYTLVTAYRTGAEDHKAAAYSYGGNNMFYSDAYEAYAWIVAGAKTVEEAKAEISKGTSAGTIPTGNDVNGTGIVDNNDVALTFQCYKVFTPVTAANVQYYLRADVNASHKVDMDDISAVFVASVTVG